MDLNSFKLYVINLSAITVSTMDILEDSLKILLLLVTIGYTAQKWYELKKNKKDERVGLIGHVFCASN